MGRIGLIPKGYVRGGCGGREEDHGQYQQEWFVTGIALHARWVGRTGLNGLVNLVEWYNGIDLATAKLVALVTAIAIIRLDMH